MPKGCIKIGGSGQDTATATDTDWCTSLQCRPTSKDARDASLHMWHSDTQEFKDELNVEL